MNEDIVLQVSGSGLCDINELVVDVIWADLNGASIVLKIIIERDLSVHTDSNYKGRANYKNVVTNLPANSTNQQMNKFLLEAGEFVRTFNNPSEQYMPWDDGDIA